MTNIPFAALWNDRNVHRPRVLPAWWWLLADVEIDKERRVLSKTLTIDDGKYFQYPVLEIRVGTNPSAFDECDFPSQFRHHGYHSRREQRSGALFIYLAPDAPHLLSARAFNLDLNCLNTARGCKTPGDIAPEAWLDQAEDVRLSDEDQRKNAAALKACR